MWHDNCIRVLRVEGLGFRGLGFRVEGFLKNCMVF